MLPIKDTFTDTLLEIYKKDPRNIKSYLSKDLRIICDSIGFKATMTLVKEIGGVQVTIPNNKRTPKIIRELIIERKDTYNNKELAKMLNVDEKTIRNHLTKINKESLN